MRPTFAAARRRLAAWPFLPVGLLVTMMVTGLVIEAAVYDGPDWMPKLPLAALAAWLWERRREPRR